MVHAKRSITFTFLIAAATVVGVVQLAAQSTESITALRKQIRVLDQKVKALESKQSEPDTAPEKGAAVFIDSKGFTATSADGTFGLKIGALIQADARFYLDNGENNDIHQNSFLLRRVRLPVAVTAGKHITFLIQPEFAAADSATGGNTQLTDAWVGLRANEAFGLKLGKFPGPVSLETPNNRHFIEASFTNQLVATRDIGIEAAGSFAEKCISYRLGFYNGTPNNSWSDTGNLGDGNFSVGGRFTLKPISKLKDGIATELAFSVGLSYGNESASDNNGRIRSYGQQEIINSGLGTENRYRGDHLRFGPAVEFYHGPFSAIAELLQERWESEHERFDNYGWRLVAGWVITGVNAKGRVQPKAPFSLENGTWGALEISGRLSGLLVDERLSDHITAFSYGLGFSWYATDNFSVHLDAVKTDFGSGVALKDEFVIFARAQINF